MIFSISARADSASRARSSVVGRSFGFSPFKIISGYSPKTRSDGTSPSGPRVSFIALTDMTSVSDLSAFGWSKRNLRYVVRSGWW